MQHFHYKHHYNSVQQLASGSNFQNTTQTNTSKIQNAVVIDIQLFISANFIAIPHSNAQISPLPQNTYPVSHRQTTPIKSFLKPCLKDLLLTHRGI